MSTRYVWDTYNVETEKVEKTISSTVTRLENIIVPNYGVNAIASTSYTFDKETGLFTPAGTTANIKNMASTDTYKYLMPYSLDGTSKFVLRYSLPVTGVWWYITSSGGTGSYTDISICIIENGSPSTYSKYHFSQIAAEDIEMRGTTNKGKVSYSSKAYPDDGAGTTTSTRSTWYQYLGSDSIDPTGVTYSKQDPQGGEEITVTVTPRSNTYGGTIYYQYYYSTNGGASWVASGSKTTNTSKAFTIPTGITQFQVRVQASDDMGFTSTDYVAGVNLTVISMLAYIGVAGKARKVDKVYVGVNGKAREVIAGYIGINGKARKFL